MAKEGHSEEQIVTAPKQYESGGKVAEICRKMGISQATFHVWKNQYAGMGVQELCELRQLREENGRLNVWSPICRRTGNFCTRSSSQRSSTSPEAPFNGVGITGVAHLGTQSGPISAGAVVDAAVSEPEGKAGPIRRRLRELAATHVRYGYRALRVLLRRQGWQLGQAAISAV